MRTKLWWGGLMLCVVACDPEAMVLDGALPDAAAIDASLVDAGGCPTDCDDGLFCNGVEACETGACAAGEPPCGTGACDEDGDVCDVDCAEPDQDGDAHRAIACGGDDCADDDPNRFPGNSEVCDLADHDEDCDPSTFGYRDNDGDGAPDRSCCNADGDAFICGTDCNDASSTTNPSAPEVCDAIDNDCDTLVDESVTETFWPDVDGDGFGTSDPSAAPVVACFTPDDHADNATDCDDTRSEVNPGNAEVCDVAALDENCDEVANPPALCLCAGTGSRPCTQGGACAAGNETCNDGMWGVCSISPVAETCNQIDDDCDGTVDDGVDILCYVDADNDGYAASGALEVRRCPDAGRTDVGGCPAGTTNRQPLGANLDCLDANPTVRPSATEVCNGVNDDCDMMTDEGVTVTCFTDLDGDGYAPTGSGAMPLCPIPGREAVGGCPLETTNRASSVSDDCDDAASGTSPAAFEICDGTIDHDCDDVVDQGCACANGATRGCAATFGRCAAGTQQCVAGSWTACSIVPVAEVCNLDDDDCDEDVDEELTVTCYADADNDTYPMTGSDPEEVCPVPGRDAVGGCPFQLTDRVPTVSTRDCDDANAGAHPGGTEVCDGGLPPVDEDCNGVANPSSLCSCTGSMTQACEDPGVCAGGTQTCMSGAWGPCSIQPTAELCNDADDDCDGEIDDGVSVICYTDSDNDTYPHGSALPSRECIASGRPEVGFCPIGFTDRAPGPGQSDCADSVFAYNPAATELCNGDGVNEDCDALVNEGCACTNGTTRPGGCPDLLGYCAGGTQTCAMGAWGVCSRSPLTEVCDGSVDQDCDGLTDEGVTTTCYADPDNDTYAIAGASSTTGCAACGAGTTSRAPVGGGTTGGIDCRENHASSYPGAAEICDRIDNNCGSGGGTDTTEDADNDGVAAVSAACTPGFARLDCDDFNASVVQYPYYPDLDGDGYGGPSPTQLGCTPPSGHVANGADCRDTGDLPGRFFPGAPEYCDEEDQDCNGPHRNGCPWLAQVGTPVYGSYYGETSGGTVSTDEGPALVGMTIYWNPNGVIGLRTIHRTVRIHERPDAPQYDYVLEPFGSDITGPLRGLTTQPSPLNGTATTVMCPNDSYGFQQIVYAIAGREDAGTRVRYLEIRCATVLWTGGASSPPNPVWTPQRDQIATGVGAGITGGTSFNNGCANPSQPIVRGVRSRVVTSVHRGVAVGCAPVSYIGQ